MFSGSTGASQLNKIDDCSADDISRESKPMEMLRPTCLTWYKKLLDK